MSTTWHEAEFIGQKEEAKGTNRFWFKVLSSGPVHYEAGQFFTFDLPTGEKRADRWRSYSVANEFDGSNIIELCISYKKGGLASEYFFNTINKGDKVRFKGPEGTFLLPAALHMPVVMIAAGTGIVPFRAMFQRLEKQKRHPSDLHLIFGTRTAKSVLYREELEYYAHFIDNTRVSICLSQDNKLPASKVRSVTFHQGRVHQIYLNNPPASPADTLFMICGWSAMIDETVANLINILKVPRNRIRIEMFG